MKIHPESIKYNEHAPEIIKLLKKWSRNEQNIMKTQPKSRKYHVNASENRVINKIL